MFKREYNERVYVYECECKITNNLCSLRIPLIWYYYYYIFGALQVKCYYVIEYIMAHHLHSS